ncbi:hypothetical protein BD779DRAFT_1641247 [Infundibulicybe gibba]|nr:hypothetical protein BD779DRAFT_1641247 [Infundibulicybe gibba]
MSSETAARKKRTSTDANPAPEGDHRKRRRNRTTQSCLNCHTSKRMCDRKRPACARCTQLGLTGLCVYEVDDPSQRSDTQDESSRLLKRVAELEGVIRELKNKPHPRWVQSNNVPGEEYDKWHSRSHPRESEALPEQSSTNPPSPSASPSEKSDTGPTSSASTRASSVSRTSNVYPASISMPPENLRPSLPPQPVYWSPSPQSTPSPSIMTPTEEYSQSHFTIASSTDVSQDYDLNSMFLGYPGLLGCDDMNYNTLSKGGHPDESCFMKANGGHCGCLHEPTTYNVVLELSLRLRKAADILARSASHSMSPSCLLNQRIADLDAFATNALGNIAMPPEDLSGSLPSQERSRPNTATGNTIQPAHVYNSTCRSLPTSTISPQSLHSLRSWDMIPAVSSSPIPCDDSFMSWEPPRRA